MGLVATVLVAGCASEPAKNSTPAVAPATAAAAAEPASISKSDVGQPTSTQAALADKAVDDNEVVCRNEKPLGTRIGKRVCKTRAQIKLEEQSAREMMKNRDNKSHGVVDAATTGTSGG
ncbi:MAG: hypothetical protein ABW171_13980 [Steroidobacter sp.]